MLGRRLQSRSLPSLAVLLTIVVVGALALALAACGGDDGDAGGGSGADAETPDVSDVPSNAVALVGDRPITKGELQRRLARVRRSISDSGQKQERKQLRQQAIMLLIQETALEQEARRRGVRVSAAEVQDMLDRAKKEFPSRQAYRQFLGRQTERDLLGQLRMQKLSEGITEDVKRDGENAKKFNEDFRKRWTEQTVCSKGYVVSGCANGQPSGS